MTSLPRSGTTLLDALAGQATQTAILLPEAGVRVTYDALRHEIDSVARALAAAGIRRGDRVAMALPNGLAAIVC